MFPKAILISLVAGALAVNALSIPIDAREPTPEPDSQQIDARLNPLILPGLSALSSVAGLIHPHKPKREAEPDTQIDARAFPIPVPAIAAGLTAISAAAPLFPLFHRPKREVDAREAEVDAREPEVDARAIGLPQITNGLAALSSITPLIPNFIHRHKRGDEISSREPEAEGELLLRDLQGLDARDPFNLFATLGGLFKKLKREADGEVLSRELQQAIDARDPFVRIPTTHIGHYPFRLREADGEVVAREPQGLDARDPISPLSIGLTAASTIAPLIGNLFHHKGKRDENELFLRALQEIDARDIDARDPISPLSIGLTAASTLAPLIGNLFHHKGKREAGDLMLEREIHEWVQRAEEATQKTKVHPSSPVPSSASHPHPHPHHHHHHHGKVTPATPPTSQGKREGGDLMLEREINELVQRAQETTVPKKATLLASSPVPSSTTRPHHHHHHHHKKVNAAAVPTPSKAAHHHHHHKNVNA